jgi:hypothetical protein
VQQRLLSEKVVQQLRADVLTKRAWKRSTWTFRDAVVTAVPLSLFPPSPATLRTPVTASPLTILLSDEWIASFLLAHGASRFVGFPDGDAQAGDHGGDVDLAVHHAFFFSNARAVYSRHADATKLAIHLEFHVWEQTEKNPLTVLDHGRWVVNSPPVPDDFPPLDLSNVKCILSKQRK